MIIRKLDKKEAAPMELLLLADPSEEMIRRYVDKSDCFVAEEDNKIIGVYVLCSLSLEVVEIVNVAVDEKFQGRGIGKQLIIHAVETARNQGNKRIEIGTGNSSVVQLALYQKCGFRMDHVVKDFFTKNYPEKIIENGIWCRDMIRLVQEL